MKEIAKLLDELNKLCTLYVSHKIDFDQQDRICELISNIIAKGYGFAIFKMSLKTPEYLLLSDKGKNDFNKLNDITKLKLQAIHTYQWEQAARLRDDERKLTELVYTEIFSILDTQFYFLKSKSSKIVFFLDPGNQLKGMLK
jgi:hypothetical protein